jgi:phosphoribosylformylglycinamidine synthase subunit PurL
VLLLGETRGHLGQSALLVEVFRREDGDAPPVDLEAERRNGEFVLANRALINACTDLSDGGLALAAFEMAVAGGLGVTLEAGDTAPLFGEDQGRYLIACSFDKAEALMVAAGQAGVRSRPSGGSAATRCGSALPPRRWRNCGRPGKAPSRRISAEERLRGQGPGSTFFPSEAIRKARCP